MRRTLEEECNGNLQDVRDVLQSTRADAVGALLVLLHLLERQAERIAEVCLAHRKHHPPHANAGADVPVDRIWGLLGHPAALRGCSRELYAQRAAMRSFMFGKLIISTMWRCRRATISFGIPAETSTPNQLSLGCCDNRSHERHQHRCRALGWEFLKAQDGAGPARMTQRCALATTPGAASGAAE